MSAKKFFAVSSGSAPFYPTTIPYSCRFDSARSCKLTKTPASAGNRKTWTVSAWLKLVDGVNAYFIDAFTDTSNYMQVYYAAGRIAIDGKVGGTFFNWLSLALFRDFSNWMHVLVSLDTTQASGRLKVYVNGVDISAFTYGAITDIAQNAEPVINSTTAHGVGYATYSPGYYQNQYLSDFYFIDGAALTPSTFGEFSTQNPTVWIPKTPTGLTYGTNGFHLDFADAAALGNDVSGNNNDYTSSGLASTDQMADTPTNNHCTMNPLSSVAANVTFSQGNLKSVVGATTFGAVGTMCAASGKYYAEVKMTSISGYAVQVGIKADPNNSPWGYESWPGRDTKSVGLRVWDGALYYNNGIVGTYGTGWANGDIAGIAFDVDAKTVAFYRNNSLLTTYTHTLTGALTIAVGTGNAEAQTIEYNFGATAFAYTPPTGFKALCAENLVYADLTIDTSGAFTGNANADGPFIYTGGTPDSLSIDSNAVTWGTHADKCANGFKIRTAAAGYNDAATNNWTAVVTDDRRFPYNNAQGNP